jgi:hypothetical protein
MAILSRALLTMARTSSPLCRVLNTHAAPSHFTSTASLHGIAYARHAQPYTDHIDVAPR